MQQRTYSAHATGQLISPDVDSLQILHIPHSRLRLSAVSVECGFKCHSYATRAAGLARRFRCQPARGLVRIQAA